MSANRLLLGASIALVRHGRVLVARRPKPPLEGLWSFPGGKVEWGERLEETALRELHEEVKLRGEIVGFAGFAEVIAPHQHFAVACFAARWIGGEPVAGPEAGEPRFVTLSELGTLPTTADLARLAGQALLIAGGSACAA